MPDGTFTLSLITWTTSYQQRLCCVSPCRTYRTQKRNVIIWLRPHDHVVNNFVRHEFRSWTCKLREKFVIVREEMRIFNIRGNTPRSVSENNTNIELGHFAQQRDYWPSCACFLGFSVLARVRGTVKKERFDRPHHFYSDYVQRPFWRAG